MAMTKKEFAARLLFWLSPWPISKVFPRSLRIYYFGPSGGPPPGFYDYWGVPGFYWPDPDVPPDPALFPDLPDDPFNPGDPVDPTPPDQWPDLPSGPDNPSDPYTPGPGPNVPFHGNLYLPYFDNTFWASAGGLAWDPVNKYWSGNGVDVTLTAIGTWAVDFRTSWIYFDWSGTDIFWIHLNDTDGNIIATLANPGNKVYINIAFEGYDIDTITLDGDTIQIKDIHFV